MNNYIYIINFIYILLKYIKIIYIIYIIYNYFFLL